MIPQADLEAAYREDKEGIDSAIARVLHSGRYILGDEVTAFEREFAEYLGASSAIGVANGTDALVLALKAVGVGPGTSVVTVSHTVSATVAAIELAGAQPVLADIDHSGCMSVNDLSDILDNPPPSAYRIAAILPVHLYGRPADLQPMIWVAHGIPIVDDCAHAPGASIAARRIGSIATASAFSFYPTKNLGCMGDGGAVTTNEPEVARRVRSLRQYGWQKRYISEESGGTDSRLDELQAAILRVRLRRLDERNAKRCAIAAKYREALPKRMRSLPHPGSVHHLYVVRTERREELITHLARHGISANVHYPLPVHLQPAYRGRLPLGPARCAEAEQMARECVTLPLYPEMSGDAVDRVCDAMREWEE